MQDDGRRKKGGTPKIRHHACGCPPTHACPTRPLAGAYTHYDTLPHYPTRRNQWAQGFTTCRWQGGRLQPLSVTPCHNPAFMK